MELQTLLTTALDKLYENTDLRLEQIQLEPPMEGQRRPDALLRLRTEGKEKLFAVECKKNVTKDTAGAVIHFMRELPEKGMLVANYIPPAVGQQLRANRVPFIDTVGNAFIHEPPVHIDIRGQKPPAKKWKEEIKGAAYRPTGLQVVFGFLCQPEIINEPFRTIAEKVGVAHGTVGWVMRDLHDQGFVVKIGKKDKKLIRRKELLKTWVERYAETLRPKQFIGRYLVEDLEKFRKVRLSDYHAYWGGEPAAEKLTNYLQPATFTLYMRDDAKKFIVLNALKANEQGNVELLKTFWGPGFIPWGKDTVPHILVYADLLASGQGRNIETASLIYEQELTRLIGQD
ncbi:MAG: hypothetical protein J5J00_12085 [Deltaproteobacteria bacterium]|nr:hypothetical protein [Deltaproteobacteria bacterium]